MKGLLYKDFIVNRKSLIGLAGLQLFFMLVSIVTACLLKNADLVANTNMAIVVFMFFWARIYEPRYLKGDENRKWIMALLPWVALAAYYISYRISLLLYRRGVEHYGE